MLQNIPEEKTTTIIADENYFPAKEVNSETTERTTERKKKKKESRKDFMIDSYTSSAAIPDIPET